jgi:hypothetical protein
VNGQGFTVNQTLGNGSYDVYLWLIENFQSNFRSIDVRMEGTTVATNLGDMAYPRWEKYGPYRVTVSDGALSIDILRATKGDPELCGVAIFQAS